MTNFRSAHVTRIDPEGNIVDEQGLPVRRRSIGFENPTRDIMVPNTAWRTVSTPDGGWLMVHQASTQRELAVAGPEEEPPPDSGYGGGGTPENPCGNAVHTVLSLADEAFSAHSSPLLSEATLPVDVAIAPDGRRVAIAAAGHQHFQDSTPNSTGVVWVPVDHFTSDTEPGCETPPSLPVASGQYTAVTFDSQGRILAQSREPAFITRIDPEDPHRPLKLSLEGPSRADTGHGLFHLDAGAGVSCATCHPEGGDDGHVWRFLNIGERHTPSLAIGLEGTAPFHWEGDLHDMRELVDDVHVGRMGGAPLNDEWVEALQSYMFSIPIPAPRRAIVEPAVQRGTALFNDWGCATCHAGQSKAGNENVMLGFEYSLQVPGLRSVSLHPPYMHDGRSPDLQSAVEDMLQRTRPDAATPSDEDMADMLAYLESL